MSLIELRVFHDSVEAEIVKGRLAAAGIEAVLFDSGLTASYGGALPVRLMVLDEDRDAADAVLASSPGA